MQRRSIFKQNEELVAQVEFAVAFLLDAKSCCFPVANCRAIANTLWRHANAPLVYHEPQNIPAACGRTE